MHKITTLLILLTYSVTFSFANGTLVFSHLGFEAGLSQININGLYQDEKGMLWIGTRDGVKKYNGITVESVFFQDMNNWSSTAFPTVCGDKKGHVYISVENNIVEYNLQLDSYKTIYTKKETDSPYPFCFSYGFNNLWIGINNAIYSYRDGKIKLYAVLKDKQAYISTLKETSSGKLLLGTKNRGLFSIDSRLNEKLLLDDCSEVISIYEDSKKNAWIGTFSRGLYCIAADGITSRFNTDSWQTLKLTNNYVRAICEDNEGTIWVGTMLGLDRLNLTANTVTHVGISENGKSGLSNLSVWVIMKDNQGTMWFGTFYGGLDFYNPMSISFAYNDFGTHYDGNGYPIIGQVTQDKRGDFWMCTEGKGLLYFNKKKNVYRFFMQGKDGLPTNNLKSIFYDADKDQLWIGTHLRGLCSLDIKSMTFEQYNIDIARKSTESEIAHSLVRHNNTLYIGTLLGVYQMDIQSKSINPVNSLKNKIFTPSSLLIDRQNNLWIAGNNLLSINLLTNKVTCYKKALNKITYSTNNLTSALYEDRNGRIIVATTGFGLLAYNKVKNNFEILSNRFNGLANAYISSISETNNGYYLVATNQGFSYIDKKTGICYDYNSQNGFPLFSMSPGSIFNVNNEEIVLSGVNGISSFNVNSLNVNDLPFKIYFSKLWVNNTLLKPNDNTRVLNQNLSYTNQLNLKHNQNAISIEIGNDNYAKLGHAIFQYKLEGFDKEWINFLPKEPIKYMNLPFGNYVLRVKAKFENIAKSPEIKIKIRVNPPFYLAWFAYLFYFIVIVSILGWLIRLSRARLLLQTTLTFEKRDKEHREQVNQSKLRFFTNISHELRTPLTLIIGQLELLLSTNKNKKSDTKLNEIYRSATDMNELINELMDFQKHDQGMFKIRVKEQNIIEFVQDIHTSFNGYAELKEIEFTLNSTDNEILVWFDTVQLRKVFNNLIANAFKYTPQGGKIELNISKNETRVAVTVIDNGIGISLENNAKVFDRFYQVNNSVNSKIHNTGTGIGLSLTQSIVNAHFGNIKVKSEENKGCEFSVELRFGTKHFEENELVEIINSDEMAVDIVEMDNSDKKFQLEFMEQQKINYNSLPSILIVEDDDNIRKMLIQIFDPIALTFDANNGIEGLRIAKEKMPDIVISDIMMPGISGYELCEKLKSDFEICHIPVILLTALSAVDNTIEGLNCGADDYIVKPFNVKILVTKCFGLLNNRRLLQEKFSKQIEVTPTTLTTNPLDQSFVEKIIQVIETNIENGDINIALLCSEMAMSRTRLFSKMKGITGQTPHDFIQNIKLKLAAKMIKEDPNKNITEIAEFLGFSSLNYFGKTFKEHFGFSPTSLRKNVQDD